MPPKPKPPAALPQLPAQLKGVLDAALDCIITIDTAGRVIDFNAAAERTFGYKRADTLGREMAELIIPPAMRDRHRAGLQRMVDTGVGSGMVGRRIEVHAMRADGTEFPVELTITKVTVGADTFFTAYLREDIVARLQTRFTAILDAALDCIVTIDHAGRVVDFNAAASRTFGYARDQAVGREMAELIVPPALRERHRLGLKRLVETGKGAGIVGSRIEITALHADGHEFPIELAITQVDSTGKQPFFTAYLRDLTDRHRAEASQRESQNYFEKSFHSSPALMSIATASDGKLIEINPAFERGAGYPRAEALGHTTLELGLWLHPEQRDEFLRRIRTDRVIRDLEADFRSKSGVVRTLLLNADIIELGGRPCMLTVGIDISERRRRNQVQAATYEISRAVLGGDDLPALLGKVHDIIGRLMPAKNCYVALLNADRSIISFPYFVDEKMPPIQPRPPRNGITEYVIETGRPLLASDAEILARLKTRGASVPTGYETAQWLGAPLMVDGRGIGVIAVQDYHNADAYTEEDKRLLVFVAEQTAAAIHRQQVEAAQREARTYFEKSFHSSPALMVISRVSDRRVTEANPAFLRACGYTREEVIGRTPDEIHIWVKPDQREAFLRGVSERGVVRDLEGEFRAKSGKTATFLVNADILELGGTPSLLTVGIDISERRRREQIQAATYAISQAVLAGGDLPALFAAVHKIIAGLMPAKNFYVALLDHDGARLSFPYFADERIAPPRNRSLRNGFTEYILKTAQPLLINAPDLVALLQSQGAYEALPNPAAQRLGAPLILGGRAIGVIALQSYERQDAYDDADLRLLNFVADQTAAAVQRHEAAAALARAEARYRSIFENALEGLYLSSPEGRFLSGNPALARMFGYASPAEMLTAVNDIKHQLYVSPTRRDEFLALVAQSDEVTNFESEVFRRDRSTFWVAESVRVVRDAAGGVDHFEGVAADVTLKREAARALQAAKESADAASRAKSYFLASVSHELRTPLNGILGYTQILRRDDGLTDKQREGVRVIHESADHLLALINDVLDLSKIEAGRIELHPADFDLPDFAAGVERVFIPRAREKNLLFESAVATDLPRFVTGDEQRLRQIVFNLVANAVKFTMTGGVVFSVQRAGAGVVRFSVSDTGPGIAADDVKKLFEPFTQVGKQQKAATGTGLGLAISRSLVERMGGKLHIESQLGWGSRFWFDVPLPEACGETPLAPAAPRRVLGYDGPRRRVLVVDDNPTNRSVMVDMLAPLGFELAEAADGAEALAQTEKFSPELVLMDLRLPGGIDGLEATRRLRATDHGRAVKVVAVSASAYDLDRSECFAAGCDAFLAKPFREEELWSTVERALGLAWKTIDAEETRTPFPLVVHAPPATEADALYDLAAKGDVVGIRTRAAALAAADPRLAPFAQSVLELAARFKMKAIRQFVARYRNAPPRPMSETILIVDDTPANLGVLVETLGAAGYQLMVAEDGEEALTQTASTQPDLILLDVMMPGLDGFETCRRFKGQPNTRDIPVLFMTALNETADKVKAFAAGGVDYITKPIEHEEALARVRTHLALRRLRRELEEQVALKDKFMRIASHDLRNPLCLILMAVELVKRQPDLPASVTKYLANVNEGAAQMRRVIDTFLHLKRGDASRVELNLIAAAAAGQHQFAAAEKEIRLTLELADSPPSVRGELAHLFQAVTNFVSNALKFTPRGGTVTVRTRLRGDRVRCEVVDTGTGVPAAERNQLFIEHGKLSPKPTAGEESNGLGLAIVKHLVESQGGVVGADFPTGGGSVFWFELPPA